MQLHRFDSVKEFWQCTQNYLLQYEAEHNALLGVLHTLLYYPERYPEPPYLALVQTNDQILAIAIRTPPNNLLLSNVQDLNALNLIAQDLQHEKLPGVEGLVAGTEAFVQIWQTLTGQSYQRGVESRIYQLTQVEPVTTVKGHLRLATSGDRPLLLKWFAAFNAEIDLVSDGEIERRVDVELKRQSTYLWEDSVPVSMVGGRQFSSTAARIAPVYTPPEYRRKGYATASVAALSQKLLEQGCNRCFLFTDLANSTSNSIYQKIGYCPVCDWHEYSFTMKE
ncbi:GNAT family N-acetyltransferase [Leptolyngbya sp. FACHB-671]|uniref:GNAT family N-acetyltransferase n=1 Tax=Leptolyngbya sp. FACHB-671 TaxID=2692812 RepID=UPI001689AD59|nr:GNAT family N-acetyltransferase [Leptolyngbya sp. FACHB-671]MBD2066095.1 GNAT family N-acetyltransferase [Leptolyngbya sp. FACHB-671]